MYLEFRQCIKDKKEVSTVVRIQSSPGAHQEPIPGTCLCSVWIYLGYLDKNFKLLRRNCLCLDQRGFLFPGPLRVWASWPTVSPTGQIMGTWGPTFGDTRPCSTSCGKSTNRRSRCGRTRSRSQHSKVRSLANHFAVQFSRLNETDCDSH